MKLNNMIRKRYFLFLVLLFLPILSYGEDQKGIKFSILIGNPANYKKFLVENYDKKELDNNPLFSSPNKSFAIGYQYDDLYIGYWQTDSSITRSFTYWVDKPDNIKVRLATSYLKTRALSLLYCLDQIGINPCLKCFVGASLGIVNYQDGNRFFEHWTNWDPLLTYPDIGLGLKVYLWKNIFVELNGLARPISAGIMIGQQGWLMYWGSSLVYNF